MRPVRIAYTDLADRDEPGQRSLPATGSRALRTPKSGRLLRDRPQAGSARRAAGVCAPAVKDFATVRNRSTHTTEDAQPRSQTVMTYSEPSPADSESVLEAAPQEFESPILRCLRLRVDHVVQHQSTVNDPGCLPTCSDSSRRSCRKQMACKRSGPCPARARRLSRRRGCGTTAGNSEETDRPSPRYRCRCDV